MTLRTGLSVRTIEALAGLGLAALLLAACHSGEEGATHLVGRPAAKKPVAAEPAADAAVTEAIRTMAAGVPIGTSTAPMIHAVSVSAVSAVS